MFTAHCAKGLPIRAVSITNQSKSHKDIIIASSHGSGESQPHINMADDDVATRAPESDAAGSGIPGDTPAQQGASMGVRAPSIKEARHVGS